MFLGMTVALVMHGAVLMFKIPFPGYVHKKSSMAEAAAKKKDYLSLNNQEKEKEETETPPVPCWMYFLLIIPALFDLVATALCMFGLLHVNVSIYQMLRGAAIVFVAVLKHNVLGDKLKNFMWVGVGWNVVAICMVGLTAMMSDQATSGDSEGSPLVGVCLILCGAFVQSLQYAFEEKVMTMEIAAPPLLLIGMEGLWGVIVCIVVLYPVLYHIPGSDHGSYENPFNTWVMLQNSSALQGLFLLYFLSIFFYNVLAVLVTFMLNSVWHAILDNFRPITVWGTDLFIFYVITTVMGESWTMWSFLQLAGMGILLYGTAIYNAPNAGSLKLTGGWPSCFLDFSEEYDEMERDQIAGVAAPYMSPYSSPFRKHASPSERERARTRSPIRIAPKVQGGTPKFIPGRSKQEA